MQIFKRLQIDEQAPSAAATSKYRSLTGRFYVIRNTRYQNYLTWFRRKKKCRPTSEALTAPVLLSTLQSGMIFESVTIQLLILSLLLLSTAEKEKHNLTRVQRRLQPVLHLKKTLQQTSPQPHSDQIGCCGEKTSFV